MAAQKRLVNIGVMAEYLDMSKATLYSWTLQKKIPHLKMGRLVKFDLQEIDSWLKEKKINGKKTGRTLEISV